MVLEVEVEVGHGGGAARGASDRVLRGREGVVWCRVCPPPAICVPPGPAIAARMRGTVADQGAPEKGSRGSLPNTREVDRAAS